MIENRHGLVVDTELVQCSGTAERDAALLMAGCMRGVGRATVAGDKGYDTREFVAVLRDMQVTPHVAENAKRPGGAPSTAGARITPDTRLARRNENGSKKSSAG